MTSISRQLAPYFTWLDLKDLGFDNIDFNVADLVAEAGAIYQDMIHNGLAFDTINISPLTSTDRHPLVKWCPWALDCRQPLKGLCSSGRKAPCLVSFPGQVGASIGGASTSPQT
jgi:hypothetical protein